MKALVTGGAGFIGSHVVRLGLEKGWTIVLLDDFSTGYEANLPAAGTVQVVRGDVRDRAAVRAALEGVDAVFHLAACVGNVRSIRNPRTLGACVWCPRIRFSQSGDSSSRP